MRGVASGDIQLPGMTKVEGAEFIAGQSEKGLPERKTKIFRKRVHKKRNFKV